MFSWFWQYVVVDLFELEGKSYLVMFDYFSDFFEFDYFRSIMLVFVIRKFKVYFVRYGILEQLVIDNGLQFFFSDFLKFLNEWDFDYCISSFCYSQFNGKVESVVKEVKKIFLKCKKVGLDVFLVLFDYRNILLVGIQISLVQCFFNRRIRSFLFMFVGLFKLFVVDEDIIYMKFCLCQ